MSTVTIQPQNQNRTAEIKIKIDLEKYSEPVPTIAVTLNKIGCQLMANEFHKFIRQENLQAKEVENQDQSITLLIDTTGKTFEEFISLLFQKINTVARRIVSKS